MAELQIDPEALNYAHELFKKDGYGGDVKSFKDLISKDSEALNYSYNLFKKDGYGGSVNDYKSLVVEAPLKKKEPFQSKPSSSAIDQAWGSKSQPKSAYDSLVTDQQIPVQASVTSSGKAKKQVTEQPSGFPKIDAGFTTPDLKKMKEAKPIESNYFLNLKKQKELGAVLPLVKQATTLTEEDQKSFEDDYDTDKRGGGFWQGIKEGFASGVNKISGVVSQIADIHPEDQKSLKVKVDKPLKKFEDEVISDALKNKETLTQEEKESRAKDLYLKDKRIGLVQSRLNSVNSSLSDQEQKLLSTHAEESYKHLDTENQGIVKSLPLLNSLRQQLFDVFSKKEKDLLDMQKNGIPISEEMIADYDKSKQDFMETQNDLSDSYNKFNKNKEDLGTFEQEYEIFQTEGNHFLDFENHIINSSIRLAASATDALAWGAELESLGGAAKDLHERAQKIRHASDEYSKHLRKTLESHSVADYIHSVSDIVADNTLMTAGLVATGGAGVAAMAVTTGGDTYGEIIEEEKRTGVKANYSQKILAPLMYGMTTVAPMLRQLGSVRNTARVLESAMAQSPGLVEQGFLRKATSILTDNLKGGFKLGNDLQVMAILQQGVNHFVLDKDVDYNKLFDAGVYKESAILHVMNSVAPHIMGVATKPFYDTKEYDILRGNAKLIIDANESLKNKDLSPEEVSLINSHIDRIASDSHKLITSKIGDVSKLPDELVAKIIEHTDKSSKLRAEALIIKTNASKHSSELVKEMLRAKEIEYKETEKARLNILTGQTSVVEVLPDADKRKKAAEDKLKDKITPDQKEKGIVPTEKEIVDQATKDWGEEQKTKAKVEEEKVDSEAAKEQATESEKITGTPDVISEPIEIGVKPKPIEEAKPIEETIPKTEVLPIEMTPVEAQQSRVDTAKTILNEAKTKADKNKAMTELVKEEGKLSEIKANEKVKPTEEVIKLTLETSKDYAEAPKEPSKKENDLREELNNVKKQIADVVSATKEADSLLKKEALRKQRDELNEKRANLEKELKGKVKDLSNQVTDVFNAGIEALKVLGRTQKERFTKIKEVKNDIATHIKESVKSGNFTSKQTESLIKKLNALNVENPEHVSKFKAHVEKIFADHDYDAKLGTANKSLKLIKKFSNDKSKDPMLRELGKQFSEIDPSRVEDVDTYNEIATSIHTSLSGSKVIKGGIKVVDVVDIKQAMDYVKEEVTKQNKEDEQHKRDQFEELTGIDSSTYSYEEIKKVIGEGKVGEIDPEKQALVRKGIGNAFNRFKGIIDYVNERKTDPFTGEEIKMSEEDITTLSNFTSIDPARLSVKDGIAAIDMMNSYLVNGSLANMDGVFNKYEGNRKAFEFLDKGDLAKPLRMYFSKSFARTYYGETATLDALITRAFKGFNKAGAFLDASGVGDFITQKAGAVTKANKYVETYLKKYEKSKPNKKEFNDETNIVERGMFAFLNRNSMESTSKNRTQEVEAESKAEFGRRKKILNESIKDLSFGNEKEIALSKLYKVVYDKLFSNGDGIENVTKSTDKVNIEATKHWSEEVWDKNFDEMQKVSQGVRGETLVREANYNPDVFVGLSYGKNKSVGEEIEDSSITQDFNSGVYDRQSSSFNKVTKPAGTPKSENGVSRSYINLSFDSNNSRWLHKTMIDTKTAATTKRIAGFLDSPAYIKIIAKTEDRNLIDKRIKEYVALSRGASKFDQSELNDLNELLNVGSRVGATIALGGISQGVMQTIPVALNTAINAGGIGLKTPFAAKSFHDWIDNSGYSIANRGAASNIGAESLSKIMETTKSGTKKERFFNKAGKVIGKSQEVWLKTFLERPDVYIARASWGTYYEQKLGSKVKDWSSHELNKDAADYAQRQVDRQQNISDPDLRGSYFTSNDPLRRIISKTTLPFTGFILNQQARLSNDLAIMRDKSASPQDKALARKSYAAGVSELAAFSSLKIAKGMLIHAAGAALMGVVMNEKDEDEYMDKLKSNAAKNVVTDLLSPISLLNNQTLAGADYVSKQLSEVMGGPDYVPGKGLFGFDLSPTPSRGVIDWMGSAGIPIKSGINLYNYLNLASNGIYNNKGKESQISSEARSVLIQYAPFMIGGATGVLPNEMNLIGNDLMKLAKKTHLSIEERRAIMHEKRKIAKEKFSNK